MVLFRQYTQRYHYEAKQQTYCYDSFLMPKVLAKFQWRNAKRWGRYCGFKLATFDI